MNYDPIDIALTLAKIGLVFFVILTLAAYLVFAERKLLAWIQDRKGPNRVGPFGLLQPLADLIKMLDQGGLPPGRRRQVALLSGPGHGGDSGDHDLRSHPLWRADHGLRPSRCSCRSRI